MCMRNKVLLILLAVIMVFVCSCVMTRNNVDIFPNTQIPEDVISNAYNGYLKYTSGDYRLFDNYRTYLPAEKIFVMQTLLDNAALAHVAYQHYDYIDGFKDRYDNLVLLIGDKNSFFYDDLVINVGSNEEVKQIGVYTYLTKNETYKTVPIVVIVR